MRLPVRNSSARASEAAGDRLTQENAAMVQETNSSYRALTDEVQDLDRIAEAFQTRSTISDARRRAA